MELQSFTSIVEGKTWELTKDISHLDIDRGSWCLYIHSVSYMDSDFKAFSGPVHLTSNLVSVRAAPRKIARTPLVSFIIQSEKKQDWTIHYFPGKKYLVNKRPRVADFRLDCNSAREIPDDFLLNIHFTIERFN